MDEIVKKAMAKWPNVPHCYGWLALDGRGNWRMRDERAQALRLPGDKVTQAALLGFINRNYLADAQGRWYFQNGPQRVYVNLASTPYIVRTEPAGGAPELGYVLHTGAPVQALRAAWMTEAGQLVLDCDGSIAMLEDRDMTQVMDCLRLDGAAVSDEALLGWLEGAQGKLGLLFNGAEVPVNRIRASELAQQFSFIREPQA